MNRYRNLALGVLDVQKTRYIYAMWDSEKEHKDTCYVHNKEDSPALYTFLDGLVKEEIRN